MKHCSIQPIKKNSALKGNAIFLFPICILLLTAFSYPQPNKVQKLPILEEYKVAKIQTPQRDFQLFYKLLGDAILSKRKFWRKQLPPEYSYDLNEWNLRLAKAGYKLQADDPKDFLNTRVKLLYKNRVVVENLQRPKLLYMNNSNARIIFFAEQTKPDSTFWRNVVIIDSVASPPTFQFLAPQFYKDKILSVNVDYNLKWDSLCPLINKYSITLGSKSIYKFSTTPNGFHDPLKNLIVLDTFWIIEYAKTHSSYYDSNRIVINGVDVNSKFDYETAFCCSKLQNKLFYFFSKKGKCYLKYDDVILPYEYDEIVHNFCCEDSPRNPNQNQFISSSTV
jgi:hypothetical protein